MLHQIGIGTLGPVFRTYEPTRDRLVAVKVFRLDIVPEQAQVLADALRRATEASLAHPSIVEPIASGLEGTLAYRAEEYVAAESLDVAMRHYAPASIEKALPFITQLAGAIDFARAAGVGHGGLHPRDIFVTPDDARATGFGVVEALEQVGIRAPIRRPYSAPERIEGTGWGTPADVFSLAAITFELLTARRPAGTGPQIGALPEGERSAALHAVLARAMDDDPSRRYPTALAFAGALESAARGEAEAPALADVAAIAAPATVVVPAVARPVIDAFDPLEAALDDAALDSAQADHAEALDDIATGREADDAHAPASPTLFGDEDRDADDVAGEASADEGEPERFADDFVEDEAVPFAREAEPAAAAQDKSVYAAQEPMVAAAEPDPEPDPDPHELPERSDLVILPIAVALVLGLLGGFAGGYFVGSRDRLVPAAESAPAASAQPAAPVPSGPATPEKPGQYSEQKVTPPAIADPAASGAALVPAPPPPGRATGTPPAPPDGRPRPERTPGTGQLVVRSTPTRAAVTLNGKWRGRTPVTIEGLPLGRYSVRVVQDGFRVARAEVTLSARSASQTIDTRLEPGARPAVRPPAAAPGPPPAAAPRPGSGQAPVSFTGSLYVDSRPRGATVLLDGKSVGQTPLSLADVTIGSHVVRIEMAGKKPWTTTARVVAGKMERVTGSLDDR